MMARAYGDAETVEQRAHVEVVDVPYQEGDDPAPLRRLAEDAHAGDFSEALQGILRQFVLVGGDMVHAESGDIIQCLGQSRGADVVRRARLELEGQFVERSPLERHVLNHLASALIGGQTVQPVLLAVEHTHAGGTVDLVAGEDVEVGIQRLYVDRHVGDALRSVHQYGNAVAVRRAYHLPDGIDRA